MEQRREILGSGPSVPYDPTVRCTFGDESSDIYAWPSRGGVIILNEAEAIDFEYLGLDPLNPAEKRDDDQGAEDTFCQKLLQLGAKWWDSEERYLFVSRVEQAANGYTAASFGHGDGSFKNVERPSPTPREKRWVKVSWPSTGGLWVSEFDTTWGGVYEEKDLPPEDGFGRVKLARTMDERCQILKERFGATYYPDLKDYEGFAFLRAWEWKTSGEAGPLLTPDETFQEWWKSYQRKSKPSTEHGGV